MGDATLLQTAEVARLLGISENQVRRLDAELTPDRTRRGVRLYRPSIVERVARERASARRVG